MRPEKIEVQFRARSEERMARMRGAFADSTRCDVLEKYGAVNDH